MVWYPQESFPTYFLPNAPNDKEVIDCARDYLFGFDHNAYVTPEEWDNAIEQVMQERDEVLVNDLWNLAQRFNETLLFHEICFGEKNGGWLIAVCPRRGGIGFDGWSSSMQSELLSRCLVEGGCCYDWDEKRLRVEYQKEKQRIRDWLYEVPMQYEFKLTTEGDEYGSFRAMSFGRKPKGRRL